jgi:hypothetical protein
MTQKEAEDYVRSCEEDEGPDDEDLLVDLFRAIYSRDPDQQDWDNHLWSVICAGV